MWGTNASAYFKYFYSGNTILAYETDERSSKIGNDTINLSNGNVLSVSFGFANRDSYTINSYTSYPNPYYNPQLACTLGVFFYGWVLV